MIEISVKSNVDAVSRQLSAIAYDQLPFATARTLTELAKLAAAAERAAMPKVFDRPTPFTVNSVAVQGAKKDMPVARVFIRDKAAKYLAPYEFGGIQFLGNKQANLVPVEAQTNQYGNLPRGTIAKYKGLPDVFIGTVKTKHGDVYGVWQRPFMRERAKDVTPNVRLRRKLRGRHAGKLKAGTNTTGHLRLLVAFHPPAQTKKNLEFGSRAQAVVNANFNAVFGKEMARAVATAK